MHRMATQNLAGDGDFEALHRRNLQLSRQVDHLSTLREIGLAISGTLDLNDTLQVIANVVQGALDVKRFTLYEFTKDGVGFRPIVAKYGDDLITRDRLEEESAPRKGSTMGKAADLRMVILNNTPVSNEVCVPIIAKNETLGVMLLQDRRDGLPFSNEDTIFFHEIGSQIGIAIHNAQLYALAVTDGLTGLYVRRYFELRMEEEFDQAARYGRVFSVLLFDIDHFKKFNDTHGHQTGDAVLKQFAQILQKNTRRADICCRYGGEEMAVVLPETDMEEAAFLANKLCLTIGHHVFLGAARQKLSVTTSIGVSAYRPHHTAPTDLVRAADEALYKAKAQGRNRVELAFT
jgi:diguanylate cyclase (GGDEF)-like protein